MNPESPITTNRTRKQKAQPSYTSINDIPANYGQQQEVVSQQVPQQQPIPVAQPVVQQQPMVPEQPKVFNISDVSKLFAESNSSGVYEINFPSVGKSYKFKQLTLGQQRTLSKTSNDFKNRADQLRVRMALMKNICLDPTFNPEAVTWADFINALIIIRNENFIDELKYNIKCDNENCEQKEFPITVPLDEISVKLTELIEKVEAQDKFFEFEVGENKVKFHLSFPKMTTYLKLAEIFAKEKNKQASDDLALFLYPYISGIDVNGTPVDVSGIITDINKFRDFIDTTFVRGLSFKQFALKVSEYFEEFSTYISEYKAKCPFCGTEKTIPFEIDDFFVL